MKVTAFLIKYGEIAIKGKNRYMFEDALMKQIRHAMAPVGDFKVRKESGRMFVEAQDEFDYDEAGKNSQASGLSGIAESLWTWLGLLSYLSFPVDPICGVTVSLPSVL